MTERLNHDGYEISYRNGNFVSMHSSTCELTILDDYIDHHIMIFGKWVVTDRTIKTYIQEQAIPKNYQTSLLDRQIVEVGPGLAQFLPEFSAIANVRPIAIDPFDYHTLIGMLEIALQYNVRPAIREILETYLKRAQIMIDPSRIKLYNTTLKEALIMFPELHGIADVVVDIMGARGSSGPYDNPEALEEYVLTKQPAVRHARGSASADIYPWYKECVVDSGDIPARQLRLDLQ